MKYVNCGCGNKFVISDEWINLDFAKGEGVKACNILKGLPLEDNSVDAVYSSCMLEHFTIEEAKTHIAECHRVCKHNGIIRIVVPDLENVCKEYLHMLELTRNDKSYESKYRYIVIELLDQMTRMYSGGEMQKYWESMDRDEEYIKYRTGYPAGWKENEITKVAKVKAYIAFKKHKFLSKFKIYNEIQLGKFMLSGETHKWMYDSYSLKQLLEENGFCDVKLLKYNDSEICNWSQYKLEITKDGEEYKPHSIYIEGRKL